MAGGKKKKKRTLFLLLGLLVLLVAAYFGVSYLTKEKGSETEESSSEATDLAKLDSSLAARIEYQSENGSMALVLDGDTWKKEGEEAFPVNQEYVTGMLNAMCNIQSYRVIREKTEELEEYSLTEPVLTATLTLSDGTAVTVKVGGTAPDGGGDYAVLEGKEGVYLISTTLKDKFKYTDSQMIVKEEIPAITTDNIKHILIERTDGTGNFELIDDVDNEFDQTGGYNSWVLKQGYTVPVLAGNDAVTELTGNYGTYNLIDTVEYACTDFAKYGLEEPKAKLYIGYFESVEKQVEEDVNDDGKMESVTEYDQIDHDFGISFGESDGQGNVYVRLKDSEAVYTMSEEDVNKLLDVDPSLYVTRTPSLINIAGVDGIQITYGSESHTVELLRESEEEESKDEITSYLVDGESYTKDEFTPFYQALIGIKREGDVKQETANAASDTPVLTVSFRRASTGQKDMVVKYLPYNDNFDRIDIDGSCYFVVSKRDVDTLVNTISQFAETTKQARESSGDTETEE